MKLVVFCLFALCCSSLANTSANETWRKLQEVLRELKDVKKSLQHSEQMLHTPPQNIEDCCCLSALRCFRANMQVHFNIKEKKQSKLYKSLNQDRTVKGLDFCNSGNVQSTCQDCHLHPKKNATEFFNRLESLIQKGIARLSMN